MKGVQSSLKDAAVGYAQQGKKVFPLSANSKIPTKGSSGFKDATADPQSVKWTWEQNPNYNIGFPCGYANGVFVLDVDNKNGVNGSAELEKLEDKYGKLPCTLRSLTPSGGVHYLFQFPKGFEIRNDQNAKIGKGLDIRGEGGYIVVAPSIINGKTYEWVDTTAPVAEAPEWVIDLIKEAITTKPKVQKAIGTAQIQSKATFKFTPEDVPAGSRNNTCFLKASWLRGQGYDLDDIFNIVQDFNLSSCNPPLDEKEIFNTCRSVVKYPPNEQELNPVGFKLTDKGNAQWFAVRNANRVLFDNKQQRWLVWGGHWWMEDKAIVFNLIVNAARERQKATASIADPDFQKNYQKWTVGSENLIKIKACIEMAENEQGIYDAGEGWDNAEWLLGLKNGVINLATGEIRDGKQEDKLSHHTDIVYDKAAQCPKWLQFMQEIFQDDPELIGYVKRVIGYCLTGSIREQKMWFCYGGGSNGKSVMLKVLLALLGTFASTTPSDTLDCSWESTLSNDLADLVGKRLVWATETKTTSMLNEAKVKQMVGGDEIKCRKMHKDYFVYQPVFKLMFTVNDLPKLRDNSRGMWRRIHVIPFLASFEGKENANLADELKTELPGILNWAIEGCLEWQKQGLNPPEKVLWATKEYEQEQDFLSEFVDDCCEATEGEIAYTTEVYKVYSQWCENKGFKEGDKLNNRVFGKQMARKFTAKQSNGKRFYEGVKIKDVLPFSNTY